MFGPYKSREEWFERTKEMGIDLKESGPRYGSMFGAILSHKCVCGCEKFLSIDRVGSHEIFTPCKEHEDKLPPFDVDKKKEDEKPKWEDQMLKRKGRIVHLRDLKKGDSIKAEGQYSPSIVEEAKEEGVRVSSLHPSRTRREFISWGTSGTISFEKENELPEIRRLNRPNERY